MQDYDVSGIEFNPILFVGRCNSPEVGQLCSISENGLNQNLSVVWSKFLKVVFGPFTTGTPTKAKCGIGKAKLGPLSENLVV